MMVELRLRIGVSKFISIIISIFIVIAFFVGLLGDWDSAIEKFDIIQKFATSNYNIYPYIESSPIEVFILMLVILYCTYRNKVVVFIKSKLFFPVYVISEIHDFQHLYEKFKEEIKTKKKADEKIKLDDYFCRNNIANLLTSIRNTLSVAGLRDTSINIKIPISKEDGSAYADINNIFLKTYERTPSEKEDKKSTKKTEENQSDFIRRSNREVFIIADLDDIDCSVSWMKDNAGKCKKTRSRCNSAYIYVLGSGSHSWISNNLKEAEKKEIFYSTSKNWNAYYNSLAVVAIAPHQDRTNGIIDSPFGVLIADSPGKDAFNKVLVRKLLGYFAHRLYSLLIHIEFDA